jgi:hypothetical protein
MVKIALQSIILLVVLLNINGIKAADPIVTPDSSYFSSISVRVITPKANGSGVAFPRQNANGRDVTFVWTVGHICQRKVFIPAVLIISKGKTNVVQPPSSYISYLTNVFISQDVTINGEYAYTTNLPAVVIKCSSVEDGNDLALLRVHGKFFNQNTVKFDLSGRIPRIGELLYNVGSPYDEWGMFTTGIFSFIGRNIDGLVFDQTTIVVFPGSSGSPVFSSNGKCVGLVTSMRAPNINYIVPIRRIQKWVHDEKIEWALDPNISMPSDEVLKELKRDDQIPIVKKPRPAE